MEMHQLRYVVALARTGNFSRAAEECHVSQPSLSQQVQKLEDELGERLFDRLNRETRLTAAGQLFVPRAVRILAEAEDARREAQEVGSLLRGRLSVGVLPTLAPYLLPPVVAEFSQRFPGVELIVEEDTTAQLVKQVSSYDLDCALVSPPLVDERIEWDELFSEELRVALPPGHELTRKRLLRLEDLVGEPFIVMKEGHCLGDQVLRFCDRREVRPRIQFRSAQLETIQSLVCAGLGVSLIPAMATRMDRAEQPEYRSLSGPRPERKVAMAHLRQRPLSRAATEFGKILSAWAKRTFS